MDWDDNGITNLIISDELETIATLLFRWGWWLGGGYTETDRILSAWTGTGKDIQAQKSHRDVCVCVCLCVCTNTVNQKAPQVVSMNCLRSGIRRKYF